MPRIIGLVIVFATTAMFAILSACSSDSASGGCSDCPAGYSCLDGRCIAPSDADGDFSGGDSDDSKIDGDLDTVENGDNDSSENAEDTEEDGDWDDTLETDTAFEHYPCTYDPELDTPKIAVSPNEADFGSVQIGDSSIVEIEICNASAAVLDVSSLQFAHGTSNEFFKEHESLPIVLKAGMATRVRLHYIPDDNESDHGELHILSGDMDFRRVAVPLISSIKTAGNIIIEPEIIQFWAVEPGIPNYRTISVTNTGNAPTSVSAINTLSQDGLYEVEEVTIGDEVQTIPYYMPAGEISSVKIKLNAPPEDQIPEDGLPEDKLIVDWDQDGTPKQSSATLTTKSIAICGVPEARPDQEVEPLDTVYIDGSGSHDDNGSIIAYKWEWHRIDGETQKPEGAYRAVIKNSKGENIQSLWTTEAKPNFYAELAGQYIIKLSLCDSDDGYETPEDCGSDPDNQVCTDKDYDLVTVNAVPHESIHIQLIWSKEGNDHDLHLVRPGGTFSRANKESRDDCHWLNCDTQCFFKVPPCECPPQGCPGPLEAPDWGLSGLRDDDPTLDIDDIKKRGPENINLSLPEEGRYLVAVENYAGTETLNLTVRIYLFGSLAKTYHYGPPYTEDSFSWCHHWNVAWLDVKSATEIDVIKIHTVEFSNCSSDDKMNLQKAATY